MCAYVRVRVRVCAGTFKRNRSHTQVCGLGSALLSSPSLGQCSPRAVTPAFCSVRLSQWHREGWERLLQMQGPPGWEGMRESGVAARSPCPR